MASAKLNIKVVSRASRNGIAGVQDDGTLKLWVMTLPVRGAANRVVVQVLAKALNLPARQIKITTGIRSSRKIVRIDGLSVNGVHGRLGGL